MVTDEVMDGVVGWSWLLGSSRTKIWHSEGLIFGVADNQAVCAGPRAGKSARVSS